MSRQKAQSINHPNRHNTQSCCLQEMPR
jgi:hypothetical protein